MADESTIYQQAHLVAAAIRVFAHQKNRQPVAEEIAAFLGFSLEMTLHVLHKMEERGIIQTVPSAFKNVLYLRDHTRIEELAAEGEGPSVAERYQEVREAQAEKTAEIDQRFSPAFQDARKKDLFASLKEQLKAGGKTAKPNPLDELTKK